MNFDWIDTIKILLQAMVPLNCISFFMGNFGNVLKTNNFSYSNYFKNDAVESMGGRDNS